MFRCKIFLVIVFVAILAVFSLPTGVFADDDYDTEYSVPEASVSPEITLVASKIVCDNETDLPNFGNGGPDIMSHTASDFVSLHNNCHFESGWSFEWGYSSVTDPGKDFVGAAGNGWHTFGVTDQNGAASTTIPDLQNSNRIWVREILKDGYIPFTFDGTHPNNTDTKSAETYCHDDVLKYDNYDFIRNPKAGKTYYCVAWNVLKNIPINTSPVITLLGSATTTITAGDIFADPGATAHDEEDGDISPVIVTGTVSTSTPGTYALKYNIKDSKGLSAAEKVRTVVVQAPVSQCSNIVVVSDETNTVLGGGNAVLTYSVNPRWTAVVPGAKWIWKTFFVEHPLQDETNTFVKTFSINGEIASSSLLVAADNSYKVWINDTLTGADATEFNYFESGKDTYVATNLLHEGTNTITFEVKNWKLSGGTPQTNPAGVLYRLEIGRKTCPIIVPVNHAPVITLLGDNPLHLTVGDAFDPFTHATTTDPDGDSVTLHASSTVSTTTAGTYQVDYTAEDFHGLVAEPKTLTIVVAEAPMCRLPEFTSLMSVHTTTGAAFSYTFMATSTGTSTPVFTVATSSLPAGLSFSVNAITGTTTAPGTFNIAVSASNMCGTITKTLSITVVDPNGGGNNPINHAPIITLLGSATTTITAGDIFADPGATAHDEEDGDISPVIVTGTVSTSTTGTYALKYNIKDSKGLSAAEKVRAVIVKEKPVVVVPPHGGGVVLLFPKKEVPIVPQECYYLREFIKFGADNNPEEVKKLQAFLNSFEGENLAVDGFYDVLTLNAVNAFQAKYKTDILDPWGHEAPTGFVYLTTRKQVNEIYCRAAFPLDQNQNAEVAAFKKLLESLKIQGIIPFGAIENQTGLVLGTTTPISEESENESVSSEKNENVSPTPVTGRGAFRHLLAAAAGSVSDVFDSYGILIIFIALIVITGILLRKLYKEDEWIS